MGAAEHDLSTMATRLAPNLRYFSSNRPPDEQGHRLLVLLVFEDHLAGGNFLGVARNEIERAGFNVPLWVSYRELLDGSCWKDSDRWEKPAAVRRRWSRPGHSGHRCCDPWNLCYRENFDSFAPLFLFVTDDGTGFEINQEHQNAIDPPHGMSYYRPIRNEKGGQPERGTGRVAAYN